MVEQFEERGKKCGEATFEKKQLGSGSRKKSARRFIPPKPDEIITALLSELLPTRTMKLLSRCGCFTIL